MKNAHEKLVALVEGAVMVALAVVLNFLKVDLGPEGGSVNLVFVPLIAYALRRGTGRALAAGTVFGVLKCILGGGIAYGWQSLLLDYAVAYGLTGLAGLLPEKPVAAALLGSAGCLASFTLSGVIIWGQYMPETFWGLPMGSVWVYSLLYNGSFTVCNAALAAAVLWAIYRKTALLHRQGN